MSRFSAIDLSRYPVADVLDPLDYEAALLRLQQDFTARWEAERAADASLPAIDIFGLESDPLKIDLEVAAFEATLFDARVNDRARSLTLAGALGARLDHIGATYYRTARRLGEDDETYRQRLALAPESWSTAGPQGAYVFWALSAHPQVEDVAVYSEDEGVCLAPRVRVVVLAKTGADEAAVLAAVRTQLSRTDIRPLGDLVTVEAAVRQPFDLPVHLTLLAGAAPGPTLEAARRRLLAYCQGRLRYAGEGETGPVWLIGRTLTAESLAGVAMGGDPNILEADVRRADVNPAHPLYRAEDLAGVGNPAFQALPSAWTAFLFAAPALRNLTLTHDKANLGWQG